MKHNGRFCLLISLILLVTTTCTTATKPLTPTPTQTSTPMPTLGTDYFIFEPDNNILEVTLGEARISHDNGETWNGTTTGQLLASGDRIQVAEGGIALIHLLNGAVIRLEGPTDLEMKRIEGDIETGQMSFVGTVWFGQALFQTPPLLTPDSLFQLHVMTSFINVKYDAALAQKYQSSSELTDDLLVVGGGLMDDENEQIIHFQGPASMYVVDKVEEGFAILDHPVTSQDQTTTIDIPFHDDIQTEVDIENFLPTAGFLVTGIQQEPSLGSPNVMGSTLIDLAATDQGDEVYLAVPVEDVEQVERDLGDAAARQSKVRSGQWQIGQQFPVFWQRYIDIPNIYDENIQILLKETGFGCDPASGLGCPLPAGCNQTSGEGCTLTTGCNTVTRTGCQPAQYRCKYNFLLWLSPEGHNVAHTTTHCSIANKPACDPNKPGDCDRFYKPENFSELDEMDEEIEWCWCTATVPPGWPPPPPGMDMRYRCWCDESQDQP